MPGRANPEIVARFEIARSAFLAPDGTLADDAPAFARNREALVALYRAMVETRAFDARAVTLQRTGQLGTYASSLGQEAVPVGAAAAMRETDVLVPAFREHGAQLMRGVSMTELLLYWGGDERGSDFAGPRGDFPVTIPVGDQYPLASGVALGLKLKGAGDVAVVIGGEGSTSKGAFHEALNVAGVWALPLVVVINNNQWAISVSRAAQTAAETVAQKAIAAGVPGEQVDGCDVIAVREAVERAIARAREGAGPSLIECVTYRLCDHTTADDASRYRPDAEVSTAWEREPIRRLRAHLAAAHGWGKAEEEALIHDTEAKVEAAVEAYLATPPAPPTAMFDHLYATLPAAFAAQRAMLAGEGDG